MEQKKKKRGIMERIFGRHRRRSSSYTTTARPHHHNPLDPAQQQPSVVVGQDLSVDIFIDRHTAMYGGTHKVEFVHDDGPDPETIRHVTLQVLPRGSDPTNSNGQQQQQAACMIFVAGKGHGGPQQ